RGVEWSAVRPIAEAERDARALRIVAREVEGDRRAEVVGRSVARRAERDLRRREVEHLIGHARGGRAAVAVDRADRERVRPGGGEVELRPGGRIPGAGHDERHVRGAGVEGEHLRAREVVAAVARREDLNRWSARGGRVRNYLRGAPIRA